MARPLRIEYEGAFYHVTARGNEQRRIYHVRSDYEKFKDYLQEAQQKFGYLLHCYVLMSNHYHLIIETPMANLSRVMHYINGSYTVYLNIKRKRRGHLFQGRYRAILVDRDRYLLELSRYVHLNPVRAGVVAKPEDYPHSSYRSYAFGGNDNIVHCDLVLGMVSKDQKKARRMYRNFVEKALKQEPDNPLGNIYGGAILGGQTFIRETLSKLRDGILQRREVSHRRVLQASYGFDEIIDAVCSDFEVSRDDLVTGGGESRDIAIYLMKRLTGMTNSQIGQLLGGLSYSGVAKVHQRFSTKLARDEPLRKRIKAIKTNLSNVKG
ncbi:MAG: transposase [Deltaproteobacteria bacterium]|nr:transposase [Deltaproteobacteria bacterium]